MLSLCSRWFTKAWNPWFWDTPRYGAPRTELFEQLELAVSVMDHSGTLVTLPFDLRIPFSRYIARNGVVNMKRFDIGCVYGMRVSDACIMTRRFWAPTLSNFTSVYSLQAYRKTLCPTPRFCLRYSRYKRVSLVYGLQPPAFLRFDIPVCSRKQAETEARGRWHSGRWRTIR